MASPGFAPSGASMIRWMTLGVLLLLGGCGAGGALADRLSSDPAAVETRLASAARQAGDLGTAVQLYREAADSPSASPQTLADFGDTLVQAGEPEDAIQAYSRVDKTSAAGLDALLGLVRAHMALDQPAAALRFADQARMVAPHDPRVQVDRGVVLDSLHRHIEAQQAYGQALAAHPWNVPARNDMALSLALTGRYDKAIAIMEPLARSSEATPKIRDNLALILGLSGDPQRAAAISRLDLNAQQTAGNLAFMASVRDAMR